MQNKMWLRIGPEKTIIEAFESTKPNLICLKKLRFGVDIEAKNGQKNGKIMDIDPRRLKASDYRVFLRCP